MWFPCSGENRTRSGLKPSFARPWHLCFFANGGIFSAASDTCTIFDAVLVMLNIGELLMFSEVEYYKLLLWQWQKWNITSVILSSVTTDVIEVGFTNLYGDGCSSPTTAKSRKWCCIVLPVEHRRLKLVVNLCSVLESGIIFALL